MLYIYIYIYRIEQNRIEFISFHCKKYKYIIHKNHFTCEKDNGNGKRGQISAKRFLPIAPLGDKYMGLYMDMFTHLQDIHMGKDMLNII